jgi:hypothetical protein
MPSLANALVLANGRNLSGYLRSMGRTVEIPALEATTFADVDGGAEVFKPGLPNDQLSAEGFYDSDDTDLDAIDDVLGASIAAETLFTVVMGGDGFGKDTVGYPSIKTSYEISGETGELQTVSIEAQSKQGRDRMEVLHALAQEVAPGTNGTPIDHLASSANGGVAHLHVPGLTLTETLDAKVQHSVDGVVWVDLITFAQVADAGAHERKEVSGTVERHVRALWTISTGGAATFHVSFGRRP